MKLALVVAMIAGMVGCGGGHFAGSTVITKDLGCGDPGWHEYEERIYGEFYIGGEFNCGVSTYMSYTGFHVSHPDDCYETLTRSESDDACLPIPKELQ